MRFCASKTPGFRNRAGTATSKPDPLALVVQGEAGEIGDEAIVAVAEELFLDLDAREAGDGQSSPR